MSVIMTYQPLVRGMRAICWTPENDEYPHLLAYEHQLFAMNTEWEKPSIGIETIGENLILILPHTNNWRPDNCIFIYELRIVLSHVSFLSPFSLAGINQDTSNHPICAIFSLALLCLNSVNRVFEWSIYFLIM